MIAGGLRAPAQEPARAEANPAGDAGTAEEVRRLVKDLESRLASEQAQVRKTEESLARVTLRLARLVKPDDPRVADLQEKEAVLTNRLKSIERLVRNRTKDQSWVNTYLEREGYRAEIRKLVSR
jgi:hypothetical protein